MSNVLLIHNLLRQFRLLVAIVHKGDFKTYFYLFSSTLFNRDILMRACVPTIDMTLVETCTLTTFGSVPFLVSRCTLLLLPHFQTGKIYISLAWKKMYIIYLHLSA